jgi:hypothetical protein
MYTFAWCRGRSAGIQHAAVEQTAVAKEEVKADEKAELKKAKEMGNSGDTRAAHDYLLDLAERTSKAARPD